MTTCPICRYIRKPSDTAPGYRCPKCGQAYPDEPASAAVSNDGERESNLISPATLICRTCGTMGNAEVQRRGSATLEVFFYFFLVFPGIFYSIWRSGKRKRTCKACGTSDLIPIGTPAGRSLLNKFNPQAQVADIATEPIDSDSPSIRPVFRWALVLIVVTLALVSLSSGK